MKTQFWLHFTQLRLRKRSFAPLNDTLSTKVYDKLLHYPELKHVHENDSNFWLFEWNEIKILACLKNQANSRNFFQMVFLRELSFLGHWRENSWLLEFHFPISSLTPCCKGIYQSHISMISFGFKGYTKCFEWVGSSISSSGLPTAPVAHSCLREDGTGLVPRTLSRPELGASKYPDTEKQK